MPPWRAEIEGAAIALVGSFNPKIFQPAWLEHHGLIRPEEAESAENLISVPQLTTFSAGWLALQVTSDLFQVSTSDPAHFEALSDLVLAIFTLLEHTPFNKMGLNRNMHFKLAEERYVAIGHFLVPKDPWRGILKDPRTGSLTVQSVESRGKETPTLRVTIEPSTRVEFGLFIGTNEHYEVSDATGSARLMSALRDNWFEAQRAAQVIANHLLNQEY